MHISNQFLFCLLQLEQYIHDSYPKLCQSVLETSEVGSSDDSGGYCFYDTRLLTKVEILSSRPLVVLFHQLISLTQATDIKAEAASQLEAPKTVSAKSGVIDSASKKRSGKVAFLNDETVRYLLYSIALGRYYRATANWDKLLD